MLTDLTREQLRALPDVQSLQSTRSDNYKTMRQRDPELAKHVGMVCPDCHEGHLLVSTFYTLQCANPECHQPFEDLVARIPYPSFRRLNIPLAYIALDQRTYDVLKHRVNTHTKLNYPFYTLQYECKSVGMDNDIDPSDLRDAQTIESAVIYLEPVHVYDQHNAIAFKHANGRYLFGMLIDDVLDEFNNLHEANKETIIEINGGLRYGQLITYTRQAYASK